MLENATVGGWGSAHHGKRASELGRRALGGKNGCGGGLGADAKAENEAGDEHVVPGVCKGLPKTGQGTDDAGNEDCPTPSKDLVHGVSKPAPDKSAAEVRGAVEEADEPGVALALGADAKLLLVEDLGAVDHGLVHALDSGTERAY